MQQLAVPSQEDLGVSLPQAGSNLDVKLIEDRLMELFLNAQATVENAEPEHKDAPRDEVLEQAQASQKVPTRGPIGSRFARFLAGSPKDNDEYKKLSSFQAKEDFRLAWLQATFNRYKTQHTYSRTMTNAQLEWGTHHPLEVIWKKESGTLLSHSGLQAANNIAMRCISLGGNWVNMNTFSGGLEFMYVKSGYRDKFEEAWQIKNSKIKQGEISGSKAADGLAMLGTGVLTPRSISSGTATPSIASTASTIRTPQPTAHASLDTTPLKDVDIEEEPLDDEACADAEKDDVEPDTTADKKGKGESKEPGDPDKIKPNKRRNAPNDAGKAQKKPKATTSKGKQPNTDAKALHNAASKSMGSFTSTLMMAQTFVKVLDTDSSWEWARSSSICGTLKSSIAKAESLMQPGDSGNIFAELLMKDYAGLKKDFTGKEAQLSGKLEEVPSVADDIAETMTDQIRRLRNMYSAHIG